MDGDRLFPDASSFTGRGGDEQLEVLWLDLAYAEDERVYGSSDCWAGCGGRELL